MPRLGRRTRQAPTLWFGASDGSQEVTATFLDQTGALFAPVLQQTDNQGVDAGYINQAGTLYALVVESTVEVSPALISQVGTVFSPTIGAQYLAPTSDIATDSWTDQDGGTTNLYSFVDEIAYADSDYIQSPFAVGPSVVEMKFAPAAMPLTMSGHVLTYRYKKDLPAERLQLTVRLMQGARTIASWIHTDYQEFFDFTTQELTPTQAATITDYTDLRVQFETLDV